jgi:dUTP pyrophosphatase
MGIIILYLEIKCTRGKLGILLDSMELQIKKLHIDAKVPTYAHADDAGMDLYTSVTVVITPGERTLITTGIAMAIPVGYVGLIWDKSGLSNKTGLKVLGGVIDAGYRGEVMVGILNTASETHTFAAGDKVAQMLIQTVVQPQLVTVDELGETARGDGAFGSTGV